MLPRNTLLPMSESPLEKLPACQVDGAYDTAALRLVAAVRSLSTARSLAEIIEIVRKAARSIAQADGATFILRDGDYCHYVDEDAIRPLWKGQRFPIGACISGWAMLHGRPAVVKEIGSDSRLPLDVYRPTFVESLVMVPIRVESPVGAIGIYWARRHQAGETEVELLQALASSTAVALENVLLYQTLERRVEERTRRLENLNRELETFSYSVSHDLQAPLRHIAAYAELLAEGQADRLDAEGCDWLARIRKSAATMSELIDALLRLARYTRADLVLTEVDLTALARELDATLRQENAGRQVEFAVEEGLRVRGDASLLRVLMQNLLGNAWKFTARRTLAHIRFGAATQEDGSTAYFVRDDGAGFDMRYAAKLFAPFHRLHAARDFPGTGIGLATIQRIVHRHGGMIWAEAAVEQGAT